MKVLLRKLAAWRQRLSPPAITPIGLGCVLGLGLLDYYTPGPWSFVLFYLLVVVAVARRAGKWHAVFVSGVAVITMATVQWGLGRGAPQTIWVVLWNNSTRFLVFSIAGWLTAEVTRLTRHLSDLVAERTAQWQAEAEQHKATSTRLTEALERFEQVINNISEVFWLTNVPKNEMVYISPGYERIWGRTCAELYRDPKSWATALHPADRDSVFRRAQTEQAAGSYDVEYRIIRPDGAVRWIRDRAFPVRNEQGEVCRIAGLAQDITERKQTREVLQTQAAILENMAEGVVVTDERGVIVQMNPAGERIWGYERNEVLGQPAKVFSALPEPEATEVMQEVLEAVQTTGSWRGTFKNRRKDGAIIRCEAVINRVKIQDRVLLVAVEQDVTERLRTQADLQRQARVLESMAEAVLMIDETGTIVLTNPALDALVGYEPGELAGQPMHVLAGVSLEAHNRMFKASVEQITAHGTTMEEYLARRKDGTLVNVETRSSGMSVEGRLCLIVVGQDITERKRREEALRQSEETLRVFLNALPEPALLLERDGTLLAYNRAFARDLAMPEGELIGKPVFALFSPKVAEGRRALVDQVIRTREQMQVEDTRDGRHLMNFVSPVLDAAGNVTRVAVFSLDITQRKQAETVLRESEQTYRALVETTGTGYLILDLEGRVLDANTEYVRLSGHKTLSQILGRSVVEWTAPHDQERNAAAVKECLKTGMVRNLEIDYAGPNGLITPIEVNGTVVNKGNRRTILSLCRDITQRKQVESALAKQEALYRTLFELSPDGILLEDANGNILDVNQALCQSFGYSREELLHQNVRWFVPPDRQDGVEAHLATLRTGQTLEHEEWNIRKDGQRRLIRLNEKPLTLPDGRQGILVVNRDITESKRGEMIRETFLSLGAKLSAAQSPAEAARAVYAAADQLWQWDIATLSLYSQELDRMEPVLFYDVIKGKRSEVTPPLPAGAPTPRMRRIMQQGAELILRKKDDIEEAETVRFGDTSRASASIMGVPMRREGRPVGVLSIQSYTPDAYSQDDLRALQALADYCAGALERIQAEAALKESEERYRSLVTNLNVGVYRNTPGPQGRFLHANPALARMHGYDSVEEFQKVGVADLYQMADERKTFLTELLRQESLVNYEVRLKKKDGTPIYGSVSATVHRGLDGEVDWIDGMLEDITQRKKAEQSLAEALELNRTLVSASTVGIAVYKASGQCLIANAALARISGGRIEQLLQQDFRQLKSWHTDGLLAKAELALQTGQPQELEARRRTTFGRDLVSNCRFSSFTSQGERHLLIMVTDETEAASAQEALRASEERYRALAESSPDAIFILDRDIKVQYVNSKAAALWKRTPEELIGLTQPELFPPEVAKRHCRIAVEVFKTGQSVRRDEPLAFPTGEQWIEIRLVPLYGEQGKVSSVMGVCRDITDRKGAERQLAEALDLNQKMIAASVVGIGAYKASGECVFANEALARAVGGGVSEVQQGNFRRLKSWQESALLKLAEEALTQGQARSGEVYCVTRFGKAVWLDCHAAPFVSNGQPHLLIMVLDISERKRVEQALKLQSLVVQNMAEGALLASPDQTVLFANTALETTFGYAPGELIGQKVAVLNAWSAEESARFNTEVIRATAHGDAWSGEYQNRRKDGTLFTSEARIRAIELDGRLHFVSVQQDITERKRLEGQILEISDREQARIGQDIHDGLCQHLVSLAFDANALQRELSVQGRPEVKIARRIADLLDQAISESRQLSRGLFPVRLGTVGLAPALHELANSTSARFKIQCRFDSQGPVAVKNVAIATHLYRVAQEAVANAVKHSRAGKVFIRLKAGASQIELRVEDDGAGLSPGKRKKAAGLGLHIMDYRARAIGGTLHIGPRRRGGTIVSCCVPRLRG